MPTIQVDSHGIQAVADLGNVLGNLLRHAESVKPAASSIEPPLEKSDFGDLQGHLTQVLPRLETDSPQSMRTRQYAVIETAVRDIFGKLVAATPIESPAFVKVWNLLDLLSLLSDMEQCDPALLFWLVEELLDSQTISGCRRIFDFLESRRQRITTKHFKSKQLIVLRSCNELLRRLSRARDTAFCGRVFIFMFQSFPLGDKSSVNLRGEYHVENVTTFDKDVVRPNGSVDQMDIDSKVNATVATDGKQDKVKATTPESKTSPPTDVDTLYPVFWSLQESFSQPKKLFDRERFVEFQSGLEATLAAFKMAQTKQLSRSQKQEEDSKPGQKRKRESEGTDMADSFNPKYLTSRDLFELELSDVTFRRYILVQALIIMEFLLSLSAEAKEIRGQGKVQNKSVTYSDQYLSKEDAEWASKTRDDILAQLQIRVNNSNEGAYFVRIVQTILARDKNWVRWKIDSCPPIEIKPLGPDVYAEAKKSACRSATSKRLRPTPMNALSIDFLGGDGASRGLDKFKVVGRYQLPELDTFKRKIAEDDLEIELPTNNQTKAAAVEGKASKTWRALRIAGRSRLVVFDKIEDPDKVDLIFEDEALQESTDAGDESSPRMRPEDPRALIISGPAKAGKSSLVKLLLERHPGVFGQVPRHTTRALREGESGADGHVSVDATTFNTMIDGDQFLEFSTIDGDQYGTSRRAAESISDSGKVPIMKMSCEGARQSKATSLAARHIFVRPPDMDTMKSRLLAQELPAEQVEKLVDASTGEVERSGTDVYYDEIIANEDLEVAYKALERVIYGAGNPPLEVDAHEVNAHEEDLQVQVETV